MKTSINLPFNITFALLALAGATSWGKEDPSAKDITDAKAAFATFRNYEKTDDIRSLDLYSQNCSATFIATDGKIRQSHVIPPKALREEIRREIALKRGNHDVYKAVKYSKHGPNVLVTASVRSPSSSMRGSFLAVYGRDSKKILKIQQLRLTAFVPYIYTPADFKAIFLKMPSPEYSYEARRRRFTGSGLFRLFVDEKGQVESVKILKSTGYPELDSSSVKTLREWQARPGNRREVDVPVNFIMGNEESNPRLWTRHG